MHSWLTAMTSLALTLIFTKFLMMNMEFKMMKIMNQFQKMKMRQQTLRRVAS